ncbi:MAG: UvrD-helicase domain-containing protein [Acholeplasmatales bacterium]|nr:UvrD-helicase domain-containing protein [Acholeplasmatales bacterium]
MKKSNRKIFLNQGLNEDLKNRLAHIDNGIAGDSLIPEGKSFDVKYNREVVKVTTRFIDFLKYSDSDEINKYFNQRDDIKDLSNIYKGLKEYIPSNSFFKITFIEEKALLKENEYKLLAISKLEAKIDNIKDLLNNLIEWKKEYIPTDTQKRIANYSGYNVVLGAAGTGKTDVAIHSYINSLPLDKIKNGSIKDDVFITYSKKLSDYVCYMMDIFWDDYKNPIKKNVYTTKDFLIQILSNIKFDIKGYELKNNSYVNNKNLLNDVIANNNTFLNWTKNGFEFMNKVYVPNLNSIIEKYGIDYPYLFFRGIYKGKIINKVSDEEINDYFTNKHNIDIKEFESLKTLLDDYVENSDDLESFDSFDEWYKLASRRYTSTFKQIPARFRELDGLYNIYKEYFDFANPVRENKKYIDYFELFKREALLIEGYRGETRKDFDDEIKILYEMCIAYQKYLENNNLYDDNDLAYFVLLNIDKVLEDGSFKNIIVDEFQDMTERQVHTIVKLTNGGVAHIFGDFEQTINPTFLQMENVETIYMVNDINDYEKQILSSSFRYSQAICRELEALREKGKKLFGTEDMSGYLPLVSNASKEFETGGNLLLNFNKGKELLKDIAKAKLQNIMYIVSDNEAKQELINDFKVQADKVFTVSESKGREEDFVVVYKLCTSKAAEYEGIFSDDYQYSRAGRIFYNQLYVGITRCKVNFLEIEDDTKLGPNTIKNLTDLIAVLLDENIDLFKEELLSSKANFYFRAIDSFRNLDFKAASDNLSFYLGTDFDNLKYAIKLLNEELDGIDNSDKLAELANEYKIKRRYDLARVIYVVLDNNNMQIVMDLRENINVDRFSDLDYKNIILNEEKYLNDEDIEFISKTGYFERKKNELRNKISNIHAKG